MENKERKSLGYRVGEIIGVILGGCVITIVVALTIKLVGWLLF